MPGIAIEGESRPLWLIEFGVNYGNGGWFSRSSINSFPLFFVPFVPFVLFVAYPSTKAADPKNDRSHNLLARDRLTIFAE
jgi:hypothetical protein